MGEMIYGESDVGHFYWNIYSFKYSLFHDEGIPFIKSYRAFHPHGISLLSHTNTILLNIYALCFDNHIMAMNTYALLHLLLGGSGMYIFTKHMTNDKAAAVFSTILFCFCSYSTYRFLEHINMISIGFIPFYLLCFFKTFSFKKEAFLPRVISQKHLLWAIFLLFINFFMDQVIGASLMLATFSIIAGQIFLYILYNTRKIYFLTGLFVLFTTGHFMIYLLRDELQLNDGEGFYFSSNLIWFFIPVGKWLIQLELFDWMAQSYIFAGNIEATVFVGFSTLTVLGISLWYYVRIQHKNHITSLIIVAIGIILLLMHPEIQILHKKLCYSPTAILHFIPVVNNFRVPPRIIIVLIPFLAVMCGLMMQQAKSIRLKKVIWPVVIVLLMVELYPENYQHYNKGPVPAYYEFLSKQKGETALIIPFGRRDGKRMFGDLNDTRQLFYQEVYQKKLISGYISRVPDEYFDEVEQDTVLQHFSRLQQEQEIPAAFTPQETGKFMKDFHPDWIVVTPPYANDEMINYIRQSFKELITKEHEVEGAYLFHLKPI